LIPKKFYSERKERIWIRTGASRTIVAYPL